MDLQLVPLRLDDYDRVTALWDACQGLGQLETRTQFASFLDRNPGLSLAAWEAQRLVGAVLCGHDGRRGYLYHLAVAADSRGRRVARRLVQRCLELLGELGISRCSVHVYGANVDGVEFWRRIGWRHRQDLVVLATDLPSEPPRDG